MSDQPDPLSGLTGSGIVLHELYLSFVHAGFTPEQAMQLCCTTLANAMKGNDE